MKDISAHLQKFMFFIFSAVVICFTASLTFMLAGRLIPGNTIMQAMTIVLFDMGAFVWFNVFIGQAKGTLQWAVSFIGFVVSGIGVIIMAAGELILGQRLVTLSDPSKLGWLIILTVVVAALVHFLCIYAFLFLHPNTFNRIEMAKIIADKVKQAHEDARLKVEKETAAMTNAICEAVFADAFAQLESECGAHKRSKDRQPRLPSMIPGAARDVPYMPLGGSAGVPMPMTAATAAQTQPRPNVTFQNPGNKKRNGRHNRGSKFIPSFGVTHNVTAAAPGPVLITPNPTPPHSASNPQP